MRSDLDFSPYRRSTVGFDRLFDHLERGRPEAPDDYPQFDIESIGEDTFRVTLAVPGFTPDQIEIVAHQSQLTVAGNKGDEQGAHMYLHRGITIRPFERRFELADYVRVQDASLDSGLLRITLKREIPEAMKPHRIEIGSARSG